jgi:hypothetical protein
MHVCPSTGGLIEQESRSTEAELGLLEGDKGARREDPTDIAVAKSIRTLAKY